jgi:mannose-6-phosphate isomerase-like protein (cupin superfamily)
MLQEFPQMNKKYSQLGFRSLDVSGSFKQNELDQYSYTVYKGKHNLSIELGDSCYYIDEKQWVTLVRGVCKIESRIFAVVVRGYAPAQKSAELSSATNLPYINGCSTRQIFPPERPGDPTLQLLKMPAWTTEQAHHIHPTARVVYVLSGNGECIVGNKKLGFKINLKPGMVCVFDPMCAHHFETKKTELVVLPLHVWSSIPGLDFNHPMFNGTLKINSDS